MTAFWAAQQAIYETIQGVSPPIAGGRVYDEVPQTNPIYPYIEIGTGQVIPNDTSNSDAKSDDGVDEFFDLHIWSRERGQKQVKEIADELWSLFHNQSISVDGRTANCWVETIRFIRDPDGITRHGIVTIRVTHRS